MKNSITFLLCLQLSFLLNAQKTLSASFDHVALSVKNLDVSAQFYTNLLELKEIKNRGEKDGIRWFSFGGDKELHLVSTVKGRVKLNKAVHFAVSINNFDVFIQKLKERNIKYSDWPGAKNTITTRADNILQVYIQDPDGYWIEVNSVAKAAKQEVTTFYFIRHAEKDRSDKTNRNPHLTEAGKQRAKKWSVILKHVAFDVVYSTDYNRTKETAQPTADNNNLELTLYNPRTIDGEAFLKANKGKTALIVGHSNTTPAFVNSVMAESKYEDINDNNNGNIYIVTIIGSDIQSQVLYIN